MDLKEKVEHLLGVPDPRPVMKERLLFRELERRGGKGDRDGPQDFR